MHDPLILKTLITLLSVALRSHSCRILHCPIRTHFSFSSTVYISETLTQHSEGQSITDVQVYGPDWKAWVIQGLLPQYHYFTEGKEKRKIDVFFFCRNITKTNKACDDQVFWTNMWRRCHPSISLNVNIKNDPFLCFCMHFESLSNLLYVTNVSYCAHLRCFCLTIGVKFWISRIFICLSLLLTLQP